MTDGPPGQRLFVEFRSADGAILECPLDFSADRTVVLAFMSWAFGVRYGAVHELAEAAKRLEVRHGVKLRPLLRYADRDTEDEADRREFERVWQHPADLAACCRAVVEALSAGDATLDGYVAEYGDLAPRLLELAAMADWGSGQQAQVRLSFRIERPPPSAARPAPHEHGPFLGPRAGPPDSEDPRSVH